MCVHLISPQNWDAAWLKEETIVGRGWKRDCRADGSSPRPLRPSSFEFPFSERRRCVPKQMPAPIMDMSTFFQQLINTPGDTDSRHVRRTLVWNIHLSRHAARLSILFHFLSIPGYSYTIVISAVPWSSPRENHRIDMQAAMPPGEVQATFTFRLYGFSYFLAAFHPQKFATVRRAKLDGNFYRHHLSG